MKKILNVLNKKMLVSLLVLVMAIIGCINLCNADVRASEGVTLKTDVVNYINDKSAPIESGKLFAGWYADAEYTKPIKTTAEVPDAGAYAKFVDENVLSIKLQTKDFTDENGVDRKNMRVVTSVDSDQYYRVGFEIEFNNSRNIVPYETYKIMERIDATAASGYLTYDYSPNVVDVDSKYFMSVTIANINASKTDKCFYIRPYWKTLDGTKVYGVSRYVSVAQGESSTNINIPVKLSDASALHAGDSVAVTLTHYNLLATNTTNETATVAKVENGYAHLNIPMTQVGSKFTSLNSATLITVDSTSDVAIYRNLQKSNKDVDVSWFRAYAQNNALKDSKYVITTVADLYGFAELVNLGSDNKQEQFFSGKEVQLCADIIVNSIDDFDATQVTAAPTNIWEAIGSGSSQFQGTFDGKNNTISGLYQSSDASYVGLFGQDNSDAIYRNFKLENTYFKGTKGYVGGVAALSKGNFDNIDVDATIIYTTTSEMGVGGLVGQLTGDRAKSISNCSFNGSITASGYYCGGLVGWMKSSGSVTISNCENKGDLTTTYTHIGGFIGRNGATASVTIKECKNSGSVRTTTENCGGFLGSNTASAKTSISNCENSGTVTSSSKMAGGFIGKNTASVETAIDNCLNSGNVIYNGTGAEPNIGGFIGRTETTSSLKITNSMNTGAVKLDMTNNTNATLYFAHPINGRRLSTSVTLENVYYVNTVSSINNSNSVSVGNGNESGTQNGTSKYVDATKISGVGAYVWTKLDFREESIWAAIENDTPQLTIFAQEPPMDLYGVHRIDIDWYNDTDTDFTITTADELYGVAYLVNTSAKQFNGKTITLGADIAINPATWNAKAEDVTKPEYSWTPIGVNRTFQGTFSGLDATTGKMHTISGLYATGSTQFLGLFGQANASSHICNLKLNNCFFQSTYSGSDGDRAFVGSIAGYTKGNVTTVYSDAVVVGQHFGIGGMIGSVTADSETQEKTISNCQFAGKVILNTATGRRSGGLIGTVGAGGINGGVVNVKHCLYTGTLTIPELGAGPQCGGIVGRIDKGSCTIEDSLSAGSIIGTNYVTQTGSIAGQIATGATLTLKNVYATTECISCTNPALSYDSSVTVGTKDGTLSGEATAMAKLAGSEGYQWTILDFDNYWVAIEDGVPQLISFQTGEAANLYGVMQIDTTWFDVNESSFTISTPAELYGLAYLVNNGESYFEQKTITMANDITVNPNSWDANATTVTVPEYTWTAIANSNSFRGTFDGGNYTISGLYQSGGSQIGLFGYVRNEGTIKNVQLKNSYFNASSGYVGSIAGYTKGNIENVYSNAHIVSAGNYVGGIVGAITDNFTHDLTNCWYDGYIETSGRHCGGMTGAVWAGSTTLTDCLFTGTIVSKSTEAEPNVGGMIGSTGSGSGDSIVSPTVQLVTCLSAGTIDASAGTTAYIGSLVGHNRYASGLTFADTYATEECYGLANNDSSIEPVMVNNTSTVAQSGTPTAVLRDNILNEKGSEVLVSFDFTNVWTNRSGDVPGLKNYYDGQCP